MSSEVVKVTGVEGAVRTLEEIKGKAGNKLRKEALMRAGEIIQDAASAKAPVSTGALAINMTLEWDNKAKAAKVGPSRDQYYGYWVELGTFRMSPQPFLRPALDENFEACNKVMGEIIGRGVEDTGQ